MTGNHGKIRPNSASLIAGPSMRGFGFALTNLSLAYFFGLFAYANARSFLENPRLSVFLIVVTESIVALFLVIRRNPDETRHTWQTWITTTCGTLAPFLLRPSQATEDLLLGEMLQVVGFVVQIAALLYLNRSFGLLPAHRGVKSGGLYGLVRHPLYTAYLITFAGFWINNQSLHNAAVVLIATVFMVMRVYYEEALLIKYAEYKRYASRIRWRLIPSIW